MHDFTGSGATRRPGSEVVFGMTSLGNFYLGAQTTAYMYGTAITLDDVEPPTVTPAKSVVTYTPAGGSTASNLTTDWIDGGTLSFQSEVYDPGLGVRNVLLSDVTGGANSTVADKSAPVDLAQTNQGVGGAADKCSGGKDSRCPRVFNNASGSTIAVPVSEVASGSRTLRMVAHDAVGFADGDGHTVRVRDTSVRVDHTAPTVTLGGALYALRTSVDAASTTIGGLFNGVEDLEVSATDSESGVASLEVLVDGTRLDESQLYESACSADGCPNTVTHTFSMSSDEIPPGDHTITVVARDQLGSSAPIADAHTRRADFPLYVGPRFDELEEPGPSDAPDPGDSPPAVQSDCVANAIFTDPNYCKSDPATNEALRTVLQEPALDDAADSPLLFGDSGSYRQAPVGTRSAADACPLGDPVAATEDLSHDDALPRAARYGIADGKYSTGKLIFDEAPVQDLKVSRVRIAVPYDVVISGRNGTIDAQGRPSAGCLLYQRVYYYLKALAAQHRDVIVSFNHRVVPGASTLAQLPEPNPRSNEVPESHSSKISDYETAVRAFMAQFPEVREYGAWNEPNFGDQPTRADADNAHPGRTARIAGEYWGVLNGLCQQSQCVAIAGEFSDNRKVFRSDYFKAYEAGLGGVRPPVWGIHPYVSIASASYDKFIEWIERPAVQGSAVWVTETGSYLWRALTTEKGQPHQGLKYTEAGQAQHLATFFQLFTDRNAGNNHTPLIRRYYYYQWFEADQTAAVKRYADAHPGERIPNVRSDEGLSDPHTLGTSATYHLRAVYDTFKRRSTGHSDAP